MVKVIGLKDVFYLGSRMVKRVTLSLLICLTLPMVAMAKDCYLSIAVASNFVYTLSKVLPGFEKKFHCNTRVISGSTGKIFAQIAHGAPFDVFLAADTRPFLLVKKGLAIPGTLTTYAVGNLVLLLNFEPTNKTPLEALNSQQIKHIALANPATAPYGKAAIETLKHYKLYKRVSKKLVFGQNINQCLQLFASGNAGAGFIAKSQLSNMNKMGILAHNHFIWEIPQNVYAPIIQQAVVIKRSTNKALAKAFLTYLSSRNIKKIIVQSGYRLLVPDNKVKQHDNT